ncbi:hypothetical protein AAFF_G00314530 [Aldrovandia affinis]|uniref:Histone H1 n=1 Tax=Aldrovandia affinis TaxID=143900 RepID=A0AAD7R7W3_9TELE|nr:hypothetical protein AAFF_G00314530 [Aldrovandia affinis]
MAEEAPAPATAAPATKVPKKKAAAAAAAAKPRKAGPSVGDLIVKAVSASKEKSGMSLPALKKALAADSYDVEKGRTRIKLALKKLVENKTLVQTKGTGASGSFKLNNKKGTDVVAKKKPAKKTVLKAKKPAAKKASPTKKVKKATPKKKPVAKKSPKKPAAKAATPKKVVKSAKKWRLKPRK